MPAQKFKPNGMNQSPGLICPQCGFRIQVTIEMLLNNPSICCTSCGLELSIDRDKSKPALNSLKAIYEDIKEAENLNVQTGTGKQQ